MVAGGGGCMSEAKCTRGCAKAQPIALAIRRQRWVP